MAHPQPAIFFFVGLGVFCVVGVEEWQVTRLMLGVPYALDGDSQKWETWKAGWVYVISGWLSQFYFQRLGTRYQKAKKRLEISYPQMYVPPLCLFPLWNANVLLKDSASYLMIRISQVIRPLPRYLEKWDLFEKEIGKQKGYLKRKVRGHWTAVCPMSTVLTISEDLKCGRAEKPQFCYFAMLAGDECRP